MDQAAVVARAPADVRLAVGLSAINGRPANATSPSMEPARPMIRPTAGCGGAHFLVARPQPRTYEPRSAARTEIAGIAFRGMLATFLRGAERLYTAGLWRRPRGMEVLGGQPSGQGLHRRRERPQGARRHGDGPGRRSQPGRENPRPYRRRRCRGGATEHPWAAAQEPVSLQVVRAGRREFRCLSGVNRWDRRAPLIRRRSLPDRRCRPTAPARRAGRSRTRWRGRP